MRYLSTYKLFLEEVEAQTEQSETSDSDEKFPDFGENAKVDWGDNSDEESSEKQKESENKPETSSGESSSNTPEGENKPGEENKNTENTTSTLSETIKLITQKITNAYDDTKPEYFFRPYAVSSWRTWVTFALVRDDEEKAVKSFFGENIQDQNSWWWGNVTSELSKHISFTKDGKKTSLIEALKSGQDLNTIKNSVLNGMKNEKEKQIVVAGFQLLGDEVYGDLREKTLDKENSFFWDYGIEGGDTYEIYVDPDFSVGEVPEKEMKSTTRPEWRDKINNVKNSIASCKIGEVFDRIKKVTQIIAGGFDPSSEPIWKPFKKWYNDDESDAVAWFESNVKNPIISDILDPLKSKIEKEFKYEDQKEKDHYLKEINRIKNELLPKVVKGMWGNQLWDTVEFTSYSFDRKDRVYVEIDTDI
jgi:hypothetical protein